MRKFIETIKKKWIRNTVNTTILVFIILAVFILVNMLIEKLEITPFDFTVEKIYTLSDESKEQIKDLQQNVTLYFFGYTEESSTITLAKQYHSTNEKITIEVVDSTARPDLVAQYGISTGAQLVAVQASERYKVIDASEMYTYDSTTYETIDITEQKLTNAIIDVTIADKPQVYFLTGHMEYGIAESSEMSLLATYIENDINDVHQLDLLSSDMPETCDVLVIASPSKDFTDLETERIQNYINKGGKIMWLQDPYIITNSSSDKFPNMNKILSQFGISFSNGIVCEQDADKMIAGLPDLIIPQLTYNEIVKDLYTDGELVLLDAGRINTVSSEELEKIGVTASPFIQSSEKSFYRDNVTSALTTKLDTDEEGSSVLGTILTKKIDDNTQATLVAYSNAMFASNFPIQISGTTGVPIQLRQNKDIVLNTIAYLSNREDSIRIRKDTGIVSFEAATEQEANVVLSIIFIVPIVIIIAGIVVTIIRKRQK